jgi:hypothetical protein
VDVCKVSRRCPVIALRYYTTKDITAPASITKQQINTKRPLYINVIIIYSCRDNIANISTFFS